MKVTIEEQTEERKYPYLAYHVEEGCDNVYYVYDDVSETKAIDIKTGLIMSIKDIKNYFIPLPKGTKVILEQE